MIFQFWDIDGSIFMVKLMLRSDSLFWNFKTFLFFDIWIYFFSKGKNAVALQNESWEAGNLRLRVLQKKIASLTTDLELKWSSAPLIVAKSNQINKHILWELSSSACWLLLLSPSPSPSSTTSATAPLEPPATTWVAASQSAPLAGEMMASSAALPNTAEELDTPGSSEMPSMTQACSSAARLPTELETVRSGEPLFTPNARPDLAPSDAASAALLSQTAKLLDWTLESTFLAPRRSPLAD